MKRLLAFCLICLLALPGLARAEEVDVAALDEAIRWAFAKVAPRAAWCWWP